MAITDEASVKKPQRSQVRSHPILGITMGDPAGIGPEVIAKALAHDELRNLCRPLVIGSRPVLEERIKALGLPLRTVPVEGHDGVLGRRGEVPVLDPLSRPLGRFQMGKVAKHTGAASIAFIETAVRLAKVGCLSGIVTGPINKAAINLAGYAYPGHTELLADLTKSKHVGMMIVGGPLRVMFVTTHVSIRKLPAILTRNRVGRAIRLANQGLRHYFEIPKPRIGVAALNPHAGESGLFGKEEQTCIMPAVRAARGTGILVSDPLPADSLFGKAARGEYHGVVAMYHDQGLIPLKLISFGKCVNVTVGLPIIRTSVDHGTAYDLAGKGVADPGSMVEAVRLATQLSARTASRRPR